MSPDLLGADESLIVRYRLHSLRPQALKSCRVLSQVKLGADQDNGNVGRMMIDLGVPLSLDVVEGRGANDREADQEDICLRVGERSQAIIIFLSRSIPQTQADRLPINHHTCRVVIEDGGNVFAGEGVGRVRDEETCLSDSTVASNDTLERLDTWSSHGR